MASLHSLSGRRILIFSRDTDVYHISLTIASIIPEKHIIVQLNNEVAENPDLHGIPAQYQPQALTHYEFQLIITNYKHFCLHPRTTEVWLYTQDYGRTVSILSMIISSFIYTLAQPEFSKAIIHTSPLQMLISTAEYKSAICHNMLDPVRIVTCINTMEIHAGSVNTVSKTLRFSS